MKQLEYNKLRNTIIENSEVIKEEVMRLEFGCVVNVGFPIAHYVTVIRVLESNDYEICNYIRKSEYKGVVPIIEYKDNFTIERTPIGEIEDILGKDIEIKHLLAFCGEKKIYLAIDCYGEVSSGKKRIATLEPPLDLKDQDPKELEAIDNYLIDNLK